MTDPRIDIRSGGPQDATAVLGMLDSAIAWMVARGATAQWGSTPASQHPRFVEQVTAFGAEGELHLAVVDGVAAGALAVGEPHDYAPAATERELYVRLLITHRDFAGLGVGARLLKHADDLARSQGVGLLRVDCYAGNDGKLVEYYERQGYTRTEPFTVERPTGPWPGHFLIRRPPFDITPLPGRYRPRLWRCIKLRGRIVYPWSSTMAADLQDPA